MARTLTGERLEKELLRLEAMKAYEKENEDCALICGIDEAGRGPLAGPVAAGAVILPRDCTILYLNDSKKLSEKRREELFLEIKEKGDIFIEKVPLKPLRDLRKIRGTYMELMSKDFYEGTETEDYLQITLTDEEDVPDGMAKLRTVYPNLMQLVYDNSRTRQSRQVEVTEHVEQKSEMELFEEFYEIQNNQPMSEEQQDFVRELMEELVH